MKCSKCGTENLSMYILEDYDANILIARAVMCLNCLQLDVG